jgi:double-GTPase-like protein
MSRLSTSHCSDKHCHVPEGPCAAGEEHWTKCPLWNEAKEQTADIDNMTTAQAAPPWSGCSLGTDDLDLIAARSTPHLIGIIGPHNAGKTTLLAAWYLLLCRGFHLPRRLFAGSTSFEAWESIAHWMRWDPKLEPTFPLHTSMGQGRKPGLLHLTFRLDDGSLEDVLLTDAPGEWFEKWAVQREDREAAGARWIVRNSDLFLFIVDSEALTGKDRGSARLKVVQLARRLRDEIGQRPVHVLWTKTDVPVPTELKLNVQHDLSLHFSEARSFDVSMQSPERDIAKELMDVLAAAMRSETRLVSEGLIVVPHDCADVLLIYRGSR